MVTPRTRSRISGALLVACAAGNIAQWVYLQRVRDALERDARTGLTGPAGWDRRQARLVRRLLNQSECGGLLLIDIDALKHINDRDGHLAGDRAIAAVGTAIRESVRREDFAARIGGDEFVLVMTDVTLSDCRMITTRIRARLTALCATEVLDGVTVSIGVAVYPEDGVDLDELLAAADRDLYRDKRSSQRAAEAPSRR